MFGKPLKILDKNNDTKIIYVGKDGALAIKPDQELLDAMKQDSKTLSDFLKEQGK